MEGLIAADMLRRHGYEALHELGSGHFGKALLIQSGHELFVAKVQRYGHLPLEEKLALVREVQNMAKGGDHPHLVRFRQSFQSDGQHLCIIMDYCEQGDLSFHLEERRAATGRQFQEHVVQRWLCELISGLDRLHYMRILHRDLKPKNVFISRGAAKLGDLGLSKEVATGVTGMLQHTQCGSPLYIAPEVHMGQPYSKSVDVWSLGCTLFEMMMLDYAFRGATTTEIMRSIVHANHQEIQGVWSADLVRILRSMLAKRAQDRPATTDLIYESYFIAAMAQPTWQVSALEHRLGTGVL